MLTLVLYGVIAIGLMIVLFLVAVRFLPAGEQIAPALRDEPVWSLPPEGGLSATDVADVRLPVALRGYRFAETDLLLDRLVEEIRTRDEQIAQLVRSAGTAQPPNEPAAPVEAGALVEAAPAAETEPVPETAPARPPQAEAASSGPADDDA